MNSQTGMFVASEIRPVFFEELVMLGLDKRLAFEPEEFRPYLWAKQNVYLYRGEKIAKYNRRTYGDSLNIEWIESVSEEGDVGPQGKIEVLPVDIDAMVKKNHQVMSALITDTLKRIKEMFDYCHNKCDVTYIGFSGGKDSVVLLDLCHKVLPLDIPVVFCDTDMELPDTYKVWEEIQNCYKGRPFLKATAKYSSHESWMLFGPPSKALRWCCSVHKSSPAIHALKKKLGKRSIKTLAFLGVRSEESLRRSEYDDISVGMKSQSQINAMPILGWSAHELWLYIFEQDLLLNDAYRKGLTRVGCIMCPMSTYRQNDMVRLNYPDKISPFVDVVRQSIDREFSTSKDADSFIYDGGWFARKSGVSLKHIIPEPGVERKTDRVICEFPIEKGSVLKEWLKAIGRIDDAELSLHTDGKRGLLECIWFNGKVDKTVVKWLTYAVHKAISCVGCGVCETECPTGALQLQKHPSDGKSFASIDELLCIHCMKCYSVDAGCLRYYSKRYAGANSMTIKGINKYMNFGLKPEWIEVLANEKKDFRQTLALGNRMIPSAITWFREAGLIEKSTTICLTNLLEYGNKFGFRDIQFWQLIWLRLANFSPLVKWFVCNTDFDTEYVLGSIEDNLAQSVGSQSVRRGALQSLCQLVKYTPIGEGDGAFVEAKIKGRTVEKLTRQPCQIEPIVILYGLYVMAEMSGLSAFTIRQMMLREFDGEVLSPLAIFGMQPDEFKKHCQGLASVYPDFVSCSFTLGLDEVRIYPKSKGCKQVVDLML